MKGGSVVQAQMMERLKRTLASLSLSYDMFAWNANAADGVYRHICSQEMALDQVADHLHRCRERPGFLSCVYPSQPVAPPGAVEESWKARAESAESQLVKANEMLKTMASNVSITAITRLDKENRQVRLQHAQCYRCLRGMVVELVRMYARECASCSVDAPGRDPDCDPDCAPGDPGSPSPGAPVYTATKMLMVRVVRAMSVVPETASERNAVRELADQIEACATLPCMKALIELYENNDAAVVPQADKLAMQVLWGAITPVMMNL